MAINPNNELVAKAWLQGVPGVPPNSVATRLPRDNSTWAASGFVHIAGVVGGGSNRYYRLHEPILQLDFYATKPNSDKPPWNEANNLAQLVHDSTDDQDIVKRTLTLPAAYKRAMVLEAYPMTEPTRRPDPGSYAVYGFELAMHWVTVED